MLSDLNLPDLSSIFFGSLILGFSGAIMPGPILARTLSRIPEHGFLTGPYIVFGHMLLELVLVLTLALGLSRFLGDQSSPAFRTISIIGGAVLLGFAFSMFRSLPRLRLDFSGTDERPKSVRSGLILDGVVLSAASPYWSLWWATSGLAFVVERALPYGKTGVAVFFIGHILSDYIWYGSVSALVASGRDRIPTPAYRGLVAMCALVLIWFGASFVYEGILGKGILENG